jgi:hypothetical protein
MSNVRLVIAALLFGAAALSTSAQAPPFGPMHPRPVAPPATGTAPPTGAPATTPPAQAQTTHLPGSAGTYSTVPVKKTPAGEQFFIVASLDLQKSQLLLKYPTEVTLLMKVTDQTKLVDDAGKPIKLSDLRAGDTVWLTSAEGPDGVVASRIRKGEMTVADLHRYYLDYAEIK